MSDLVGNPKDRFSHNDAGLASDQGCTVCLNKMSLVVRKTVFGVSDQVRHKPGCTVTENGLRLEISDLGRRRIVLSL